MRIYKIFSTWRYYTTFGRISEFDPACSWQQVSVRLEQYFAANDIGSEQLFRVRWELLLIRTLTTPDASSSRVYKELLELHYRSKPSIIVERFKFNSRNIDRLHGEKIAAYVKRILQFWCFVRWYVERPTGINNVHIQCRLLAETNLTFLKAMEIAQLMDPSKIVTRG